MHDRAGSLGRKKEEEEGGGQGVAALRVGGSRRLNKHRKGQSRVRA